MGRAAQGTQYSAVFPLDEPTARADGESRYREFAVVAVEVRKLAERSASSTDEISGLIGGIQDQVKKSVRHMESCTTTVDDGMKRTEELKSTLAKISSVVSEVSRCSKEIGAATSEQSSGAQQIELATARLSELTQEISAATEEQSTGTKQVVQSIEKIGEMVQQENKKRVTA